MKFSHYFTDQTSTIAAIATPPGEGGVAIIRLSGKKAVEFANQIFSGDVTSYETHTAHFGHILNEDNTVLDQALCLVMLAPKSYTGENVVELQCHGGSLMAKKVLQRALDAGARQAGPGEFTFRAYMNGQIDLAQAEAVQELIMAKNERALKAAKEQLEGSLSLRIKRYKKRLTHVAAIFEAWVDFPDEGLEFASMDEVKTDLKTIQEEIEKAISSYEEGRKIHEGVKVAIVGAPNVGKSSLLNALLQEDRAIVSDIEGTTRDTVREEMQLSGLNLLLIDTAGIRSTTDQIEEEGIKRSKKAIEQADIVFAVFDATKEAHEEILAILPEEKSLVIWNKIDLVDQLPKNGVPISAKTHAGIDLLKEKIDEMIWKGKGPEEGNLITNIRHKKSLELSHKFLSQTIEGLEGGFSAEFLTQDLKSSLHALSDIIGSDVQEDILGEIFSTFCVGK